MFCFPESLTAAHGFKMAAWVKMNTWFKTGTGLNSTILLVLLFLPALALGQQEYCSITPQHTLCNLPETGPGCDGTIETKGIDEEDITIIVDTHNKIRAKVANGEEGNQPPASNMKRMEWDEELAKVAQRWANQCSLNSGQPHDCNQCRAVSRFPVGQNALYSAASVAQKFDFVQRIQGMATDEIPLVTPSQLEQFYSNAAGHYTQIVWADTCKVGCGLTAVKGNGYSYFIICNYR
ncbi:venom allergen 5 isoform X2 [Eurytemora carolleeae]|uniref:venom allergen 5 isoform X1 n=1 Tax=Eurytemora carolleeae TaxID=1294199 RepID=UPI000C77675E|nr:venom allergen 5 isoform X1 [Eurytemora carolleeae]XP_023342247.1 venom allergen 5 isoform X2 [Eurytemora carolleeae]|eukprot:XP_023342246.1 venom allergen 5-like isoform X1 [Eurytemora affinis]